MTTSKGQRRRSSRYIYQSESMDSTNAAWSCDPRRCEKRFKNSEDLLYGLFLKKKKKKKKKEMQRPRKGRRSSIGKTDSHRTSLRLHDSVSLHRLGSCGLDPTGLVVRTIYSWPERKGSIIVDRTTMAGNGGRWSMSAWDRWSVTMRPSNIVMLEAGRVTPVSDRVQHLTTTRDDGRRTRPSPPKSSSSSDGAT